MRNLYVHFPFCRRKCEYCALFSRSGSSAAERADYVAAIARELSRLSAEEPLSAIYFGGGSPALCDLVPLASALHARMSDECEFSVELHPLDVTEPKLDELAALGVNRISMGVQSLDDRLLRRMGRDYTVVEAARAFERIRRRFDNAGIDLIVGYERNHAAARLECLADWGLRHCSVYALQNERGLKDVADDEQAMDELSAAATTLESLGLRRYEISNYAKPGRECRYNLAVWRGEDYIGLGAGASGRQGLTRTLGVASTADPAEPFVTRVSSVDSRHDELERTIFRLRTREGLDASRHPEWHAVLDRFAAEGLLVRDAAVYRLTPRGAEVCDTILVELV